MSMDWERVRENVREATTENLLDRVTAFRAGMEPEAITIIEQELARRGIGEAAIEEYCRELGEILVDQDGVAVTCSYCNRPAVAQEQDGLSLWGGLVLREMELLEGTRRYCQFHCPPRLRQPAEDAGHEEAEDDTGARDDRHAAELVQPLPAESNPQRSEEYVMKVDPERVRENARKATTEDLLDRVTVYREGMEPEALEVIEKELADRGVGEYDIRAHQEQKGDQVLRDQRGVAEKCSYCRRPAVGEERSWFCLLGLIPLFPQYRRYCEAHRPPPPEPVK